MLPRCNGNIGVWLSSVGKASALCPDKEAE